MKFLVYNLNVLHYLIYKIHYRLHLITNKINPFNLIHKLPFQKRRYEKLGINIDEQINEAFRNRDFGLSITVAGGLVSALLGLLLFSIIYNLVFFLLRIQLLPFFKLYQVALSLISSLISSFLKMLNTISILENLINGIDMINW